MWRRVGAFIITFRWPLLAVVVGCTLAAAWVGRSVALSYSFPQVVPPSDSVYREYLAVRDSFGQEDAELLLVVDDSAFLSPSRVVRWEALHRQLAAIRGVVDVLSVFSLRALQKDPRRRAFRAVPLWKGIADYDSAAFRRNLERFLIYRNIFYTSDLTSFLYLLRLDSATVYSEAREALVDAIYGVAAGFERQMASDIYLSGTPYIRTVMARSIRDDLILFLLLSVGVTALVLTIFFRSFSSVLLPMVVVGVMMTFVAATMVLLGYKVTLLMSLVPSVIAIIAVPNFIYFLNRYHLEFRKFQNKRQAVVRTVEKIGPVALLTNLTTAMGFGVLGLVDSPILREFGQVAAINIFLLYVVSMVLLPIFFMMIPAPHGRRTQYLDNPIMRWILHRFQVLIFARRRLLWLGVVLITVVSLYGIGRIQVVSRFMDNVPHASEVYRDFQYLEKRYGGIFSFDVVLRLKNPAQLRKLETWAKVDSIQQLLEERPEVHRTYSPAGFLKYLRQAYYNNNPARYSLPTAREWPFLMRYLRRSLRGKDSAQHFFLISPGGTMARIGGWIPDIGSQRIRKLIDSLDRALAPSLRAPFRDVSFSGLSVLFQQNALYLLNSLGMSVVLAVVLIAALLGWLFRNRRIVGVVLLTNLLPLVWVAGMMGLLNIPLNASSIVIFSISLGIGIDDALHFLARYRQEMRYRRLASPGLVRVAFHETARSMTYTSLVLIFGFSIFMFSSFGGIKILGQLVALAMLMAYISNLLLLPSLLGMLRRD